MSNSVSRVVLGAVIGASALVCAAPVMAVEHAWISVEAEGRRAGAFEPASRPYVKDGPSLSVFLMDRHDVRTPDGQVVSGFEFIGWTEEATNRIVVFALVPGQGAPNTYLPNGDPKNLERRDFATLVVANGDARPVSAMAGLGIEPMVVRADKRDASPDYDAFMKLAAAERRSRFAAMSPEDKAAIMRTHAERWLEANRARLSESEIALFTEIIDFISPDLYRVVSAPPPDAREQALLAKLRCRVSPDDVMAATDVFGRHSTPSKPTWTYISQAKCWIDWMVEGIADYVPSRR